MDLSFVIFQCRANGKIIIIIKLNLVIKIDRDWAHLNEAPRRILNGFLSDLCIRFKHTHVPILYAIDALVGVKPVPRLYHFHRCCTWQMYIFPAINNHLIVNTIKLSGKLQANNRINYLDKYSNTVEIQFPCMAKHSPSWCVMQCQTGEFSLFFIRPFQSGFSSYVSECGRRMKISK